MKMGLLLVITLMDCSDRTLSCPAYLAKTGTAEVRFATYREEDCGKMRGMAEVT